MPLLASEFPKVKHLILRMHDFDINFRPVLNFTDLELLTIQMGHMKDLYKHDNPYENNYIPIEVGHLSIDNGSFVHLQWALRRIKPK